MAQQDFWQDNQLATKVVNELKVLKSKLDPFYALHSGLKDFRELLEITSPDDSSSISELAKDLGLLLKALEALEFKFFLSGEFDANSAILSINAGAGGTESCDWAQMLFRMYCRFAESKGYKVKTVDILEGEEAGIKNVTLLIEGPYAYGYLKSESGVHRLVRISPFDANKRRHTSFASVDALPQIEGALDIKVQEKDLRIDVYRSSGPGGQSVNTTDSAVRITHLPSGLVVQCQNERSQYQNKQTALGILKARLYELERKKQEEKLQAAYAKKQKIEWGSQIRSYVMHPYNMVKDHRTEYETGNVQAVLDGKIDDFVEAYLKMQKSKNKC
ncbi:MAG: peptide chain release factor 2 [Omnitrophica WOR_2 bacterium RIFCSPLOWO2_12_FULL_46_30]|nr:MAG: peptide chain release factor 2 [Omnitrophica WOR_2 bacterium RIFCSPHIGHO2_02_FULL_46_37]OGX44546.1 MAG: peptide chain release factor 2 [Omnitrophica WOR_2 bacterium RIFCSPLOWO2_02_FULL_45_28]OGX51926.1 MAG: peptide chain release factor 2 [Omnitrophica WOR_2 bacterium RIFCSPLOWO2_12_FULL_46_30]